MSVINNVLKDLESRSSQFVPIEINSVESAVTEKPVRSRNFTIPIFVLLAAAALFWFYQNQQKPAVVINTPERVTETPVVVVPVTPELVEIVEPNQIIGLQINESADHMSLEFSLREKVISYLKERSENIFVYYLKDVRSEIVAPVIRDNQWIEQLSISPAGEGIDITFRTVSGVLVETRQQLQDGEQLWAIKLKKAPEAKVIVKLVEVPSPVAKQQAPVESVQVETADNGNQPEAGAAVEAIVEPKVVKLDIRSSQPKLSPDEQLQKAVNLLRKRRWSQAEGLLQGLIDGPNDLVARRHLLSLFEQIRATSRFSALLGASIERYPQESVFQTAYARSLFKTGAYQDVIENRQNIDNANATQLALIAASYQRLDQHQAAVDYYRQSLDQDGRQAKNWIGLGISQEHTAQLKDALRSYQIAARLGGINARLQAFIEKRSGQLVKAIN
jgi:tetratricopeptide (TPR) repeat protein